MCTPDRWAKRGVVKPWMKLPGFPVRVPITSLCPTVHSASSWSSFCPVLVPTSRSCSYPFTLVFWACCSGKKDASHPWSPGVLGKPPTPKGSVVLGKWSWWGRAGREIQQLLELCEGPSEAALLGMLTFLRHAHRLDSYATNQMGWAATANERIWDGVLHVTGTQRPHTPEVFAGVSMGLSLVTGLWQPVVPPSHQPRTPIVVGVMRNLTPNTVSCTQRWCTELGNKPLLWTSAMKTNQWDFLWTFSAFQQKHKTQWKSNKIFLNKNTDTNLKISSNIYGIISQTFLNFSSSFSKSILWFQLFAFTLSYRAENVLKMLFLYQHFHLGTKATITLIQQQWCM